MGRKRASDKRTGARTPAARTPAVRTGPVTLRAPPAGSARRLAAAEVRRTLERVADVVVAVKAVVRSGGARRDRDPLEEAIRPLVFAGNCLWAAADGWQEHEALVDLERHGSGALEALMALVALHTPDGARPGDAATRMNAELSLRALADIVLGALTESQADEGSAQEPPPKLRRRSP